MLDKTPSALSLPSLEMFPAAAGCSCPVIFITAYDDAEKKPERLGCMGFFPKPFEGRGLLQAIRDAVHLF